MLWNCYDNSFDYSLSGSSLFPLRSHFLLLFLTSRNINTINSFSREKKTFLTLQTMSSNMYSNDVLPVVRCRQCFFRLFFHSSTVYQIFCVLRLRHKHNDKRFKLNGFVSKSTLCTVLFAFSLLIVLAVSIPIQLWIFVHPQLCRSKCELTKPTYESFEVQILQRRRHVNAIFCTNKASAGIKAWIE